MNIEVDHSKCGGSGCCIRVCHNKVWVWGEVEVIKSGFNYKRNLPVPKYPEKCKACMKCANICPEKIIKITKQ